MHHSLISQLFYHRQGLRTWQLVSNTSLINVLSDMAAKSNSEISFISIDTEEGAQLAHGFGGLAAILRYPMM